MLIFATAVILLALSNKSHATNGKILCDCSNHKDWDSMDLALRDVRLNAKSVPEAYTKFVEQRATLYMSRYKIDLFIMECDSLLLAAREKLNKLIAKQDRSAPPDCESIIQSAQDIINDLSDKIQCLTSEMLVFTDVHPTVYPRTIFPSISYGYIDYYPNLHQPSKMRSTLKTAHNLNQLVKCAQKAFNRIGFTEGERESKLNAKIAKVGDDYGIASDILREYLDALKQDYRQDLCAEIEYDIANHEGAPPIDRIILAAVGTYRVEFERLKSKFSTTIDKPSSYLYLSLKFSTEIKKLLREAQDKLQTYISAWQTMLERYHEYHPKNNGDVSSNEKTHFLIECRARSLAKTVFAAARKNLTNLYRTELVYVPIVVELRSFDYTQWKKRRDQLIQELYDQFEYSASKYLKSAKKIKEQAKFYSRRKINWSELGGSGLNRPEDGLWNASLFECKDGYLKEPNLWLSEPLGYRALIENANVLNDYALREFALARIHRDQL